MASLGLEDKMGNLFVEKIHGPHKYVTFCICSMASFFSTLPLFVTISVTSYPCRKSMRSAVFVGFMAGFAGGLIYFMYAVLFRYGAFVVSSDEDNVAHTSYRNFIT